MNNPSFARRTQGLVAEENDTTNSKENAGSNTLDTPTTFPIHQQNTIILEVSLISFRDYCNAFNNLPSLKVYQLIIHMHRVPSVLRLIVFQQIIVNLPLIRP